jgi:hypothetical protein
VDDNDSGCMRINFYYVCNSNNVKKGEKRAMKLIILLLITNLMFSRIESFVVSYGDTTKVLKFYGNGNKKVEGIKVKKFKDGTWRYYDVDGYLSKIERYKNGKLIKEMTIGDLK